MNKEMPSPILITGCARSGTSMITGVINMCGAYGGDMAGANRNNLKGMFENSRIREDIVKPYLRKLGVDPKVQYPLPDVANLPIPNNWRHSVEAVIKNQGYAGGPWMYKGAKMASMWPIWHHAFPNAKWIIVRRKTSDIIKSCMRTGFMRAFDLEKNRNAIGVDTPEEGWLWWVHQHEARFIEMIQAGLNVKQVWPHRMVYADYEQMFDTIDWLGLKWKSEVLSFIDPLLWHTRKQEKINTTR